MKPRKSLLRRSAIKRKHQSKEDFARKYGSKARVEFVKSLPCAACQVVGYSENAHVAPASEKGTGYKAGFEWIVPLCYRHAPVNGHFGCHMALHAWGLEKFRAEFPGFDPSTEASRLQKMWLTFSEAQHAC